LEDGKWSKDIQMKNVAILGSTGSIGVSTLKVIKGLSNDFRVFALSGGRNIKRLASQASKFSPQIVVVKDSEGAEKLRKVLPKGIKILVGLEGLIDIARHTRVDIVVNGLVGSVGILPTLEAIKKIKRIALANKETIVAYGEIVMDEVERTGAELIPVDSEPSAIFQVLNCKPDTSRHYIPTEIKQIYLTASGGPFFRRKSLKKVSVEEALNHPTWKMGKKITIDSATLMNKGFEVIEASRLFHLSPSQIRILIHPHSIVHSLVEFQDGSILAQMGVPDMKLPIQYSLTYPERKGSPVRLLDLEKIQKLQFFTPDFKRFPCIQMAYDALKKGDTFPAVLSAADEVVVESFLKRKISFQKIPKILNNVMKKHKPLPHPSLEEILRADRWAREEAGKAVAVAVGSDRKGK
jgi:1-deoxy-D-xylulose-5-phosphate reductoisomerase